MPAAAAVDGAQDRRLPGDHDTAERRATRARAERSVPGRKLHPRPAFAPVRAPDHLRVTRRGRVTRSDAELAGALDGGEHSETGRQALRPPASAPVARGEQLGAAERAALTEHQARRGGPAGDGE